MESSGYWLGWLFYALAAIGLLLVALRISSRWPTYLKSIWIGTAVALLAPAVDVAPPDHAYAPALVSALLALLTQDQDTLSRAVAVLLLTLVAVWVLLLLTGLWMRVKKRA